MERGHYFTFPIKLLWFNDPAEKHKSIQDAINYSIYQFMQSGKCGNGNGEDKLAKAKELLNFKGGGSFNQYRIAASIIEPTIIKGDIYTSVKTSYLFEARDNVLRLDLLFIIAAIKSIIGHKRNFTRTNRQFILRRMYGSDQPMTRYQFDKLVSEAMAKRMFTIISAGRGYYVSMRYKPDELGQIIMQRIKKHEGLKIEAARAGKDIMTLRRQLKDTFQQIPKSAP
jgi:hypothetical protein